MSPLVNIKKGKVKVLGVQAGRIAQSRLAQLGILPGKIIEVLSNPSHGPVMLKCDNSRFMIGFGLASKVMVELVDRDNSKDDSK